MTREQAHADIEELSYDGDGRALCTESALSVVDGIFNHFENRTCLNCNYYIDCECWIHTHPMLSFMSCKDQEPTDD